MTALIALTCPVCGAPFDKIENQCKYCGVLVVIKSDHHRIDASHLNRGVINEHIQQYRQALRKDQNDEVARYGLGVAYFSIGLIEESIVELTEAARLMPENPFLQAQLGVVLAELGSTQGTQHTAKAWERAKRALMLDPKNADALVLKQDILKRHLNTAELDAQQRATTTDQLFDTWVELSRSEPERLRPLLVGFLSNNTESLAALPRWKEIPAPKAKPPKVQKSSTRMKRSTIRAFVSLVGIVLLTFVFILLAPTTNGKVDDGSFFDVLATISLIGWLVVPVAVFIFEFRKGTFIASEATVVVEPGKPRKRYEALFDPKAPIDDMLQSTAEIIAQSNVLPAKR